MTSTDGPRISVIGIAGSGKSTLDSLTRISEASPTEIAGADP